MNYYLYIRKQFKTTTALISFLLISVYLFQRHNDFIEELYFSFLLLIIYFSSFAFKGRFVFNTLWVIGNAGCWVIFYFIYQYLFFSISEFDFYRAYLFNLFLLANILVNIFFSFIPHKKITFHLEKNNVLFFLSLIVLIGYIFNGGMNPEIKLAVNNEGYGAFYYFNAFTFLFYLVSATAGYYFGFNKFNLLFIGIVLVNFIGQHRGIFLINILFYISGLLLSKSLGNQMKFIISFTAVLFSIFSFSSIGEFRLTGVDHNYASSYQFNIERVIEISGQQVIDQVSQRRDFDGFENFSRIFTMPVPAFLLKGKPQNDDANEVLKEKFGYWNAGETVSVPIPFIADAYRRLGSVGVFLFSCLFAFLFNLAFFLNASFGKKLASPLILLIAVYTVRLYPSSTLGTFAFFFYDFIKLFIIVVLIYYRKSVISEV